MQQNIYFRKHVWQEFQDEPDKSAVINDLLEEHYLGLVTKAPAPTPAFSEPGPDKIMNADEFMASKGIKPESVYTAQPSLVSQAAEKGYVYDPKLNQLWNPETGELLPHKVTDGKLVLI